MVVDTDVHHGNGTAAIFADDRTVFKHSAITSIKTYRSSSRPPMSTSFREAA